MHQLPWLVLLLPLFSAAIIVLVTKASPKLSAALSVGSVCITFVASVLLFRQADFTAPFQFTWLDFGPQFHVTIGLTVDALSKTMLIVVTGIGALIHIYSLGYMKEDDGKARYFAALSLFMFSMLGIVLANNFVMMFIFWELVGVSSYILIGHWFYNPAPPAAANKAFITNRLGDFGFMLGILMLWLSTGTIYFAEMATHMGYLLPTFLTLATLLIFCGTVGKSAQFPLHVWLPDAMEGPTPVSALIHAATMVAAGVYMLARVFFLIEHSPHTQTVIAWVGIITAVMAALIATQQNDIKRILAYSTLSQLGYMVAAIGLASQTAAMSHLFTHAFFKALLFLGAGAIIHSLHHEQNIWKMGGLKNKMPWTFLTFLLGTLALTGCPPFSGFFTKDMILESAFTNDVVPGHKLIFALALATAFLTAFYMFRLFAVVFLGAPRSKTAMHANDAPAVMTLPLLLLAIPSVVAGLPSILHSFVKTTSHAENSGHTIALLAFVAFALGSLSAIMLYSRKTEDPIDIPLLANKFYFDELYAGLIRWTQDLLARISGWFDRWIIDGAIVRGASGGTWGTGFLLRLFQVGNLQAYAFFFGIGVIALIYFVIFR